MSPVKAKRSPTDLDALQGTWRVTFVETDGDEMPDVAFENAVITVRGDQFSSEGMGDGYTGTIAVFSDKTPKAFDLAFTSGPPAGMVNRGIYKLDGDEWTICLATRGDARPRRFGTAPDSGHALETLVRGTAPRSSKTPAKRTAKAPRPASDTEPAPAGPPTEIEGEWSMASAVLDGKPLAADMVKWCKRVTQGNVTRILAGPQTMLDAEFTLDASRSPGHIDYVNRSGKSKGKRQLGIYRLDGDSLAICMAAPGKPRASDFSSAKGDGRSYTTWTRSR